MKSDKIEALSDIFRLALIDILGDVEDQDKLGISDRLLEVEKTVDLLAQVVDLTKFNRGQTSGMSGIPAPALVEHEMYLSKIRGEFDPIEHIVQQFSYANTKAKQDALWAQYRAAVKDYEEKLAVELAEIEKFMKDAEIEGMFNEEV
jgi:hypothetical protein